MIYFGKINFCFINYCYFNIGTNTKNKENETVFESESFLSAFCRLMKIKTTNSRHKVNEIGSSVINEKSP